MTTAIEWTDATWNPVRGCIRVSEGCRNCYAERVAMRLSAGPGVKGNGTKIRAGPYHGLVRMTAKGPAWTGEVRLVPEKLGEPLRWRKPRMVFVNSMSDLFHGQVPDEFIADVFGVMAKAHWHRYQILTKRPERARRWFQEYAAGGRHVWTAAQKLSYPRGRYAGRSGWPLPHVWLGVSAEDQATADERIPLLLQCPASVRFVSLEPMLGPVDLSQAGYIWGGRTEDDREVDALDWVIVGGESGPGARPCDAEWIRSVVRQCKDASVPAFVKQLGSNRVLTSHGGVCTAHPDINGIRHRKGGDPAEWPADLHVREWPRTAIAEEDRA